MLKLALKGLLVLALCLGTNLPARTEGRVHEFVRTQGQLFPHLGDHYDCLGPATKKYNCVSWSLGITSTWMWPGDRVEDFDKLYGEFGYRRLGTIDYRLQDGVEKVVLFARNTEKGLVCTNVARQMPDGKWTNKVGSLPLIKVANPELLDGPKYGLPVAVYARVLSHGHNPDEKGAASVRSPVPGR